MGDIFITNKFKQSNKTIKLMLRRKKPVRGEEYSTYSSHNEITKAMLIIISEFAQDIEDLQKQGKVKRGSKLITLSSFFHENGLLRVGGPLQQAKMSYDSIYAVILSGNISPYTRLIVQDIMGQLSVACKSCTRISEERCDYTGPIQILMSKGFTPHESVLVVRNYSNVFRLQPL